MERANVNKRSDNTEVLRKVTILIHLIFGVDIKISFKKDSEILLMMWNRNAIITLCLD